MNIYEAARQAEEQQCWISRRNAWWGNYIKIKPTNTEACCIVTESKNKDLPAKRWHPMLEDLEADDWFMVRE